MLVLRTTQAPNAYRGDLFGSALALSGDTLAVGAHGEDSCSYATSSTAATDNGCSAAGAVYVYTRSNGMWVFESYIKVRRPRAARGVA